MEPDKEHELPIHAIHSNYSLCHRKLYTSQVTACRDTRLGCRDAWRLQLLLPVVLWLLCQLHDVQRDALMFIIGETFSDYR